MSSEDIIDDQVLHKAQRGLLFGKPKYGIFVTAVYKKNLNVNDSTVHSGIVAAACEVITFALNLAAEKKDSRTRAIVAFDPNQWSKWYKDDPKLANLELRDPRKRLIPDSQKFLDTGGDVFFLLKSDVNGELEKVLVHLKEKMKVYCDDFDVTKAEPPSKRILQNSFTDGVANPCDTESIKNYIVKNNGAVSGYPGSTYLLSQKFEFNWTVIGNMDKIQKEDMVGRKSATDTFIPHTDARAHIARVHVVHDVPPVNGLLRHPRVFRLSMPYGHAGKEPGQEEGLMYMHICNTTEVFKTILKNIAGNDKESKLGEVTPDTLISAVQPLRGTFWYVPSAEELKLPTLKERRFDILDFWNVRSPTNDYLFYNQREYLHRMTTGGYSPGDPPSDRALGLLDYAFLQWNDQWFKRREMPKFPHLLTAIRSPKKRSVIQNASIMIRKGWATKVSLGRFLSTNKAKKLKSFFGAQADTFNLHPDELIVGRMPKCFSLGLGKAVMPYLREDETMPAFFKGLSEAAGMGHVIPDFETLLQNGLGKMKEEMNANKGETKEQKEFVTSCVLALDGVKKYIKNFGFLAGYCARNRDFALSDAQRSNLETIEKRMKKISTERPETLIEAVQLLFSYHCCLHLTGEPTSIGRLDQLLEPFLKGTPIEEAQEIIDCLYIKLCEHVHLNKRLLNDLGAWGMTAVPYTSTGMFANGDTINQWVQQITVGGYKANDEAVPEDACNAITIMCLKASRRLPLNAPCLSLRMHKDMRTEVLQEAAKAILSGGAHPVLPHDDHLVEGLIESGTPDLPVSLKCARNYACDGCYEPIFPGETDFSLVYVPLLQVLEMTINHGSTYGLAGPGYLEGVPQSLPTAHPEDIKSFEKLKELFALHLHVRTEYNIFLLLLNYGNIVQFCPSPLLSSLIRGCLETKRDIYDGGANYTLIGVQFITFANTVDALYAIKRLCFDHDSAVISLPELARCLKCDWGFNMQEPFHDELAGTTRGQRLSDTYKEVRERALRLPKFGTSKGAENQDIQSIASWLAEHVSTVVKKVARDAPDGQPLKGLIDGLKKKYSIPEVPFDVLLPTGSGTFEGYVGWGAGCAASADGRRAASPIASDMSAAPTPIDKPATPKRFDIYKSLKSWDMRSINLGFANGAEIDLKIDENFKESDMVTFLKNYADHNGIGGNILSITCANAETFANAQQSPEQYDLIRVRTGGWSEFYIAFFTAHQKHQERRMYYHTT